MLVVMRRNRWLGPILLASGVVALGMTVSIMLARGFRETAREFDQARFQRLVQQHGAALHDRLEKYELALQGLAEFVAGRSEVAPAEWRFRIRRLWPEQNYPGLLEIGFAEWHREEQGGEAAPLDTEAADETGSLRLLYSWLRPPSASDGISPQFLSDSTLVAAAGEAIRLGHTLLVDGREFSAELGGNPATGFSILAPVRASVEPAAAAADSPTVDSAPPGADARLAAGVVFGNVVPHLLIENLFGTAQREVEFEVFTSDPPSADNWLNRHAARPRSLDPAFQPYLRTNIVLRFPPREWQVCFYTTPLFEGGSQRARPRTTLAVGMALTLLVGALMLVQTRARLNQQDIAAELRAACDDLQSVQAERDRLSRDLHDGAIQALYGLQLSLSQYEQQLGRNATAAAGTLGGCRAAVDALITELRTFLVQQLPGEEDPNRRVYAGAALQQLVHRFQSASRVPLELVLKDSPPTPISLGQQIHLRQIVQEAISNSLRHGQPRHIKVELQRQPGRLHLAVSDDGAGFDAAKGHSGQGLANMHARAMQLGGRLRVESQPGQGTRVTFEMPLAMETSPSHEQAPQNTIAHRG